MTAVLSASRSDALHERGHAPSKLQRSVDSPFADRSTTGGPINLTQCTALAFPGHGSNAANGTRKFEVTVFGILDSPNTATAQELFNACVAHGGAAWDHSAMVRALEIMAGAEIGGDG